MLKNIVGKILYKIKNYCRIFFFSPTYEIRAKRTIEHTLSTHLTHGCLLGKFHCLFPLMRGILPVSSSHLRRIL